MGFIQICRSGLVKGQIPPRKLYLIIKFKINYLAFTDAEVFIQDIHLKKHIVYYRTFIVFYSCFCEWLCEILNYNIT